MGVAVGQTADDGGFDEVVGEDQAGIAVGGNPDPDASPGLEPVFALKTQEDAPGGGVDALGVLAAFFVRAAELDRPVEPDASEPSAVGVGDGGGAEQVHGRGVHKRHAGSIGGMRPKTPAVGLAVLTGPASAGRQLG